MVRTDAAGGTKAFITHFDRLGLAYSVDIANHCQIAETATLGEEVK